MDDVVLWAVALGVGVVGLLLLATAGLVAVYMNSGTRTAGGGAAARGSQSQASAEAAARASPSYAADGAGAHAHPPHAGRPTSPSIWAWLKAAVFAFVHAGAVSFVLGGVTFFEDLVRANDEIQQTGTVSFPKQLLPGTLSGPGSRQSLSQPSSDSSESAHQRYNVAASESGDLGRSQPSPPETLGWEVVDLMEEVGSDADEWVEEIRTGS